MVTPDLSVIHSDAVTRQIQLGLTKVMYVKFVANYWHDGSIDDPFQLSGCLYQSLSYASSCCSAPSPSDCSHQAQGCFIVPEKLRVQSTGKQSLSICLNLRSIESQLMRDKILVDYRLESLCKFASS